LGKTKVGAKNGSKIFFWGEKGDDANPPPPPPPPHTLRWI